jgi:predicted N-acetyltransferase YhbS
MSIILRRARETDAKHVASLLTELGYPSAEADARDRLVRSLRSATSCVVVAEADGEVVGVINAELVPYFPNGSTICRVTALVVSSRHRSRSVGEKLIAHVTEFARGHGCSGMEVTSSERRVDAHRFYERLGFSKSSFRFFRAL